MYLANLAYYQSERKKWPNCSLPKIVLECVFAAHFSMKQSILSVFEVDFHCHAQSRLFQICFELRGEGEGQGASAATEIWIDFGHGNDVIQACNSGIGVGYRQKAIIMLDEVYWHY